MKQRMYNTFYRKLKNVKLAKAISNISYCMLLAYYYMARLFCKSKSSMTIDEAYKLMDSCSKRPDMKTTYTNKECSKDLSIIVPAYNAEKTIRECINSVINQQTSVDYELIIVNDGSSDKTKEIVTGIKSEKIVLINQENKGFSGARNTGIDASVGKYIMFLDSDDMLVGNCIEGMMGKIREFGADIVQGSYYSFLENTNTFNYSKFQDTTVTSTENILKAPGFPWAKIYKREMFNQLRFPLNVWFEDTIVCMVLYRMCKKMVVTSDVVYAYRLNPNGITAKARHSNKCIDHYWVMEQVLEDARDIGLQNDEIQYDLVKGHMSTLLYRRISLMSDEVIECTFNLACQMLENIRPEHYKAKGRTIDKDIDRAFETRNYKLWKLASCIV